jgi:hypothetical protein
LQAWGQCKKCKKLLGYLGNMIASLCSVWLQNLLVYFCDCKKEKRKTEPVCDCNYLACVIATRSYVCCKEKPDFVCVLAKLLGYLENDCKLG